MIKQNKIITIKKNETKIPYRTEFEYNKIQAWAKHWDNFGYSVIQNIFEKVNSKMEEMKVEKK